jgi:membrane-bound lytic murein transglycosylase B
MLAGVESKQAILDAMTRPAEKVKPWSEYQAIFLTPRAHQGRRHRLLPGACEAQLRQIATKTGVPPEMHHGDHRCRNLLRHPHRRLPGGGQRWPRWLSTTRRAASFFRGELRQLFLLARDEQLDINQLTRLLRRRHSAHRSSSRAAIATFAVDGNADGRRDLLSDWDDVFASVANYFVVHDWQPAQPVAVRAQLKADTTRGDTANELVMRDTVESLRRQGVEFTTDLPAKAPAMLITLAGTEGTEYWVGFQNFYTITRYNRSAMYALAVFQLSEAIAGGTRKTDATP